MNMSLKRIAYIDILFLFLLLLSGFFEGFVEQLLYYGAFLVPIIIACIFSKGDSGDNMINSLKLSREGLFFTLPLIFPTVASVLLIAYLSSLIIPASENAIPPDVYGNIFVVIMVYAVFPAILEELLFRFIPLISFSGYERWSVIILTSVAFAAIHCDFTKLPYAFFAGVVFMTLDFAIGSVWPSVIIHALNNLASVLSIRYGGVSNFNLVFIIVISVLTALSCVAVLLMKEKYNSARRTLLNKIENAGELSPSVEIFILIGCALLITILSY